MSKNSESTRQQLIAELREAIPAGSTVYTILRSVARSGMQRVISPVVFEVDRYLCETCGKEGPSCKGFTDDNPHGFRCGTPIIEPRFWEYKIAQLLDYKLDSNQGIKIRGTGMDMGFHLVYSLSSVLYGDGYALKQRWM